MALPFHYDSTGEIISAPFDRIFIQPETDLVASIVMHLKHPKVDVNALKKELSSTLVVSHPRFSSLLVKDSWGRNWWKKTLVNVDDHVVIHDATAAAAKNSAVDSVQYEREAAIDAYLAKLSVSCPLNTDKPLWEVHVLVGLSCVVMRVNHAIGDGVSLMSMISAFFGRENVKTNEVKLVAAVNNGERRSTVIGSMKRDHFGFSEFMYTLGLTAKYEMGLMGRILGLLKDNKSVLSGCDGAEMFPRTFVTSKFKLEDFNLVKKAVPGATLNDVLMGVISSGLSKYLDAHSPNVSSNGLRITGIVLANIRKVPGLQDMSTLMNGKSGSEWGNKIGLLLVPIGSNRETIHPLQHVCKMKEVMGRKKQSFEAQLLPMLLALGTSVLGLKMGTWFYKRVLGATTLLISNFAGPPQEIAIAGNTVTSMKANLSSLPQQAISMVMVTYGDEANLQISVVKDIVPDAEFFAMCFEESLAEIKSSCRGNNGCRM